MFPAPSDARIQQPFDLPNMTVNVDRTRAEAIGLTQQNVAQSLLVALSGSFQTTPSFYLDPRNGVSYNVAVQAPQYDIQSLAALKSLPCDGCIELSSSQRGAPRRERPGLQAARRRRDPVALRGLCGRCRFSGNLATYCAGHGAGHGEPLRCAAGDRYLCQRGGDRSWHRDAGDGKDYRGAREGTAARFAFHSARAERDDGQVVLRIAGRSGLLDFAGLFAHRGEFSVVARSIPDYFGAAGGAGRYRVVPVHYRIRG